MSDIITYNPWHGDPANAIAPHRPSLAQLGGGAYQDEQDNPPDLDTMPSAAMENANEKTLAGVARTCVVARFSIRFVAGAPVIGDLICADDTLLAGDFTVTDNGNGDTSITWPAGTFPTMAVQPCGLVLNEWGAVFPSAEAIANGVRVKTLNSLGVGADTKFTVSLA